MEGDYNTVVFIKNETDTPKKYLANLTYEGGAYSLGDREIKARQTVALDFKQLRDDQTPDSSGNPIPLNVERGQISWSMVGEDNNTMSGRSEQVNTQLGISSTYACYNCCPHSVYSDGYPTPLSTAVDVGAQQFFGFQVRSMDCYGQEGPAYFTFGYGWLTSDALTVTITSGGAATAMNGGTALMTGNFDNVEWTDSSHSCSSQVTPLSGTGNMQVIPKITSISPARGYPGQALDVEINGSGFGTTAEDVSIEAGGNIVVRGIQEISDTKIKVGFSVAANADVGNQQVTVTVAGFDSNSKDFLIYTQTPTKVRRDELSAVVVREPNPGDFVNIFGDTIFTNVCGAYRNLKYTLLDQHSEPMSGIIVTEVLTDFQSNPQGITPPAAKTTTTISDGTFADVVGANYSAPCTIPPFSSTTKQGFTAKVGQTTYSLTTKNDIAVSKNSSGQWTISITNTTP